jgi:phage shock protein C
MERKLHRSRHNRVIAGVCGGLADYFNIDVVLVRLAAVLLALVWGEVILLYIIGAIVIPEGSDTAASRTTTAYTGPDGTAETAASQPRLDPIRRDNARFWLGGILVALGGIALLNRLSHYFRWNWTWWRFVRPEYTWPVILILLGVFVIAMSARKGK